MPELDGRATLEELIQLRDRLKTGITEFPSMKPVFQSALNSIEDIIKERKKQKDEQRTDTLLFPS